MKKLLFISIFLFLGINSVYGAQQKLICAPNTMPKVQKKLENWEIIAGNDANIKTAEVFSGPQLIYSIKVHPKNSKNKIMIDHTTGVIKITAEANDHFDVNVIAKNSCGSAQTVFNVIIDEEV